MTPDFDGLSPKEQERLLQLLKESEARIKFNKKDSFSPYGWQEAFIQASGTCFQLLAMTGNRCGKTFTGAFIMACHATGEYPDWWTGRRFDKPIKAWAVGASTTTVRDILQSELLGPWDVPEELGTGSIPKRCIHGVVNRGGVPSGCVDVIQVKHKSGGISTIAFKSYEMTLDKFMGTSMDVIWLDEEAPRDIYTQCVTRTATTSGIVYLTFTPEHGLTPLVRDFMEDLKPGQFLITASWDDAPHLSEETKQQLLAVYSPEERRMRTQGLPLLGDGICFPIPDEDIVVDPFDIPDHWLKIIGIDLGYDHPNGVACVAVDTESGTYYLYNEHSERKQLLPDHARAIIEMGGDRIPVQLPHDAFKRDGANTGREFIKLYQEQGVYCLPFSFTNPPGLDGKPGNNSVEYGINWMLTKMKEGKLKVFKTCKKFLREKATYHRKQGQIVPLFDDMISAARYAFLSVDRYGIPGASHQSSYFQSGTLTPYWENQII